jgi:hypothetical protein
MSKASEYFIGNILKNTNDPFEKARAILLLRLCFMFTFLFILPLITDVALGYKKAILVHSIAFVTLSLMPLIIKTQQNIEKSINLFFSVSLIISVIIFMVLNPASLDPIGTCWTVFFLVLSALMQRGKMRILFCFLLWLPMLYVLINGELAGILTVEWMEQKGAEKPPMFLILFPILLSIYAVWTNSTTVHEAKLTITEQKKQIDEKNKDILDSIHYAKRIQTSLLPTDKFIERILNEKNKKK